MKFWDSSAIVPLLAEEPATSTVVDLYRQEPLVVTWWGTEVECVSALTRLEREGGMSSVSVGEALKRLRALKSSWHEVQPVDALKETATRLLRVHPLRAADSLQLAAALIAAEHRPSTIDFVSLDERLNAAARREGFNVVVPGV